jgi:Pretoxin HINT domain
MFWTPNGYRPVESIQPDEVVFARSENDPLGLIEAKRVEAKFERTGRVFHLHQVGGEVIRTTQEHPFFEKSRGWVPAGELKSGDGIRTDAGWAQIEELFDTGEWEKVYNLRIADHHTYFVGDEDWGFTVWAHNLSCDDFVNVTPKIPPTQVSSLVTRGEAILKDLTARRPTLDVRNIVEKQLLRDGGKYYDSAPSLANLLATIQDELKRTTPQYGHYNVLVEAAKRVMAGHRVAIEQSATKPSEKADLIDYSSVEEAIQMKSLATKDPGKVNYYLIDAIDQLFSRQKEEPPKDYNLIAWIKITNPINGYANVTTAQQLSDALSTDWKFRQSSPVFKGLKPPQLALLTMRVELPNGTTFDLRYSDLSALPQD